MAAGERIYGTPRPLASLSNIDTPSAIHALVELPDSPEAVAVARRFVRLHLRTRCVRPDHVDVAELLTSELVTNAVKYGRPPVWLLIELRSGLVHVTVSDASIALPRMRHPEADSEGGRGLWLLDQLAVLWGSAPAEAGKYVWFELHASA